MEILEESISGTPWNSLGIVQVSHCEDVSHLYEMEIVLQTFPFSFVDATVPTMLKTDDNGGQ